MAKILEVFFEPVDNARLAKLCGVLDENLRQIENAFDITVSRRAEHFTLQGHPAQVLRGEMALKHFYALADKDLLRDEVQLGLIEIATEQPSIERRSAARDDLLVICSPGHPLAKFKELTARDLVGHPFIDRDPGNGIRQIADEFFEAAGIAGSQITLCAELGSLAAVKQLAAAGLGFAIASGRAIRRDVEEGRLVAIPLQPRLHTPLEVILPRDKFRSRLINAFADHVCEEFARIATEQD